MDTYSAICLLDFLDEVRHTEAGKRYATHRLVVVERHIMALRRFANLKSGRIAGVSIAAAAKLQGRVDKLKKEMGS